MTDTDALKKYATSKDSDAFRYLVLSHQSLVYAVCQRVIGNNFIVDDAVQDTFIKLAENAHRIRSNVSAWLHSCARRCALDRVRSEAARHEREKDWVIEEQSPLSTEQFQALITIMDECLDEMGPDERDMIIRYYYEGQTLQQIASATGYSGMGIKKRRDKAVEFLREKMKRKGVMLGTAALTGYLTQTSVQAVTVPTTLTTSLTKIGLSGIGKTSTITIGGIIMSKSITLLACSLLLLTGLVTVAWNSLTIMKVFSPNADVQIVYPNGWFRWGGTKGYRSGVDESVSHSGKSSLYLEGIKNSQKAEFISIAQGIKADQYRGKRIKITAYVKAREANSLQLIVRIDGTDRILAFDNMGQRMQRGTFDWKKESMVVDVPPESMVIYIGSIFSGEGRAWVDDFTVEVVDPADVSVTDMVPRNPDLSKPMEFPLVNEALLELLSDSFINLGFEEGVKIPKVYGDIGAYLDQNSNGEFVINGFVDEDSPLNKAGAKVGMVVKTINGVSVSGMSMAEVSAMPRGEPGTQVVLELLDPADGNIKKVSVERAPYVEPK